MEDLRKLQQEFLGYLLDNSVLDVVERIESTPRHSALQRMELYGNAYRLRLKETISTDYERLHAYLGDELFDNLMQLYIDNYPSDNPSLRYFGRHLVELTERAVPYSQLPEVVEIARIEKAFIDIFDVANDRCVSISELARFEAEAWPLLTLRFHDSVQLLRQHYNSFQIWRALSDDDTPPYCVPDHSTWLIWRQDLTSRYRSLKKDELAALATMLNGGTFADMCEALMNHIDTERIPQQAVTYLQQWINDQMVCEMTHI